MSISKHIKWIATALTCLMVLLALPYLTSAESSRVGLTAQASDIDTSPYYSWSFTRIPTAEIGQVSQYTLRANLPINAPDTDNQYHTMYCNIETSISGGYDLEYFVAYVRGGQYQMETDWRPVGTLTYFSVDIQPNTSNYLYFYFRRVDGQELTPSEVTNVTSVFCQGYYNNGYDIEYPTQTTALPPSWINDTTQVLTTYIPMTVTTATGAYIDDNDIDTFDDALQLPDVFHDIFQFMITVFTRLFRLKYITSYTCFSLVIVTIIYVLQRM